MKNIKIFMFLMSAIAIVLVFAACDTCQHEYETIQNTPQCENETVYSKVCTKCGDRVDTVVSPKGHDFNVTVRQATCTSSGYTEFKCDCGFSYRGDIKSAIGHDYSVTVNKPTCTDNGYTVYSCKNCAATYQADYKSAIGHELTESLVSPSCTEQGYTVLTCSRCEYTYKSSFVEPLGHDLAHKVTDPTCEQIGFTYYACNLCGYSFTSDYVEPLGHKYTSTKVELPSCLESGATIYSCDCGNSYTSIEPPLGHHFTKTTVNPTVSDMGYTEFTCDCGFNYVGNYRFYSDILDDAYAGNNEVLAQGIDISCWNHQVDSNGEYVPIDWIALKEAGVDYVILKAGSTVRDGGESGGIEPTFEMDYAGARSAGLDVGVYFFTYSTNVMQIRKDAEDLLSYLEGKQFEYPIYLDLEDVPNEDYYASNIASPILTEMCIEFFSILQKDGYYTGLYVNNEFLFNILQTDNMIDLFEIWYARYPSMDYYDWSKDSFLEFTYGDTFGMWQYTMKGVLPSIVGDVDFNYAYKDLPSIIKQHGFNGYLKVEQE